MILCYSHKEYQYRVRRELNCHGDKNVRYSDLNKPVPKKEELFSGTTRDL